MGIWEKKEENFLIWSYDLNKNKALTDFSTNKGKKYTQKQQRIGQPPLMWVFLSKNFAFNKTIFISSIIIIKATNKS